MIRAAYRDGVIQPLDEVPTDWRDGDELVVRELHESGIASERDNWLSELNAAAAKIPDRVHNEVAAALAQIEAESKEFARRELERSE